MAIPVSCYFTRAHLAFRLLGLRDDQLAWMQLLTRAMAPYASAILYPEQLIVNERMLKSHATQPAEKIYRVYSLRITGHASRIGSQVEFHDFSMVKLRTLDHIQTRASRTPSTILKWDMEGSMCYPEFKISHNLFHSTPVKMAEFLPWIHCGMARGMSGEMNMLFADHGEAVQLGARLLLLQGERGFVPPNSMDAQKFLELLVAGNP